MSQQTANVIISRRRWERNTAKQPIVVESHASRAKVRPARLPRDGTYVSALPHPPNTEHHKQRNLEHALVAHRPRHGGRGEVDRQTVQGFENFTGVLRSGRLQSRRVRATRRVAQIPCYFCMAHKNGSLKIYSKYFEFFCCS